MYNINGFLLLIASGSKLLVFAYIPCFNAMFHIALSNQECL
jgi:hypothetical protein